MREEFIFFMGRYRALEFFMQNLITQFGESLEDRFNRLPLNGGRTNLVSGAFDWEHTPQGKYYWEGLDRQWETFIKQQLNN